MKKDKIIYWVLTSIISLMMIFSAFNYFTNPEAMEGMNKIGFPNFFVKELGTFKILGALALIIPQIPARVKEWAYAGFGIVYISAFLAHLNAGDAAPMLAMPLVFLGLLVVSNIYYHKIK